MGWWWAVGRHAQTTPMVAGLAAEQPVPWLVLDLICFDLQMGVQAKAKSHDKTLRHNAATPVGK